MNHFHEVLDQLFPQNCRICHKNQGTICQYCLPAIYYPEKYCKQCYSILESNICQQCLRYPPAYSQARFLWNYKSVEKIIKLMKYSAKLELAKLLGKFMAELAPALFEVSSWDLIIPIPANHLNLKVRTFNQAAEFAIELSNHGYGRTNLLNLYLARSQAPQASLTSIHRITSTENLFHLKTPDKIKKKRLLLVDDVITTGASTESATRLLLEYGAKSVDIYALARSDHYCQFRGLIYKSHIYVR